MSMVERVARAFWDTQRSPMKAKFDDLEPHQRERLSEQVRAMIKATRYEDADEHAAIAASASVGQIDAVTVIEAHNAFIDSALAEEG